MIKVFFTHVIVIQCIDILFERVIDNFTKPRLKHTGFIPHGLSMLLDDVEIAPITGPIGIEYALRYYNSES